MSCSDHRYRPSSKALRQNAVVSTIPCSLAEANLESPKDDSSNDTPIKLLLNRTCAKSPESWRQSTSNKLEWETAERRAVSYDQLVEENARLRAELVVCQSLLKDQMCQSQEYSRKLRLKNIEHELSRLELGSTMSSVQENSKLVKEVQGLRAANQDLFSKAEDLSRSLASCRQLLSENQTKLHKKKQIIKAKDEQLRRYLTVIDEMRCRGGNSNLNNETKAHGHQHQHSNINAGNRMVHTNSTSNMNRNQSTAIEARQVTSRNAKSKQQLSRLWSGTISKTTRPQKK